MKTRGPPPEEAGKEEESADAPKQRFKRAATIVMTVSRDKVKAREALEARRRHKTKKD